MEQTVRTRWLKVGESTCQCGRCKRHHFNPWVRKIPWRRKWQPVRVFLPGEFHGQRSLVGYSPRGRKELGHCCACVCTHTQMPERLWGVQGREKVKARPCDRLKRQSPDRLWAKGREKFRVQAGNMSPCCALPTSSGSRVQVNLSHPEFPWQPGDKIS